MSSSPSSYSSWFPSLWAQAAITGVVRDASGALLPGATVEAASPVLIEKVRSAVSDASGQYRIVDLRPGTYSVTVSLTGFSTVQRGGIELSGTFVATVNADMRIGALQETITVNGETPIVDVQSARMQNIVPRDVLAAIPSSRNATGIQALIPGMSTNGDSGGISGGTGGGAGSMHGGRAADSRTLSDGLNMGWAGANSNFAVMNSFRGLAAYLIPKVDVQVSGTWRSDSGPQLAANYVVTSAIASPSLGRALSSGNVTVNLIQPGTLYSDRINTLDFRVAKVLRFGRTRAQVGVDIYNAANTDSVATFNQGYVAATATSPSVWPTPSTIQPARYAKVNVQLDF